MNALDFFLDKQIRERAYPWQVTIATGFLLVLSIAIVGCYLTINQYMVGVPGYQPVIFPDWSIQIMAGGLNWIGYFFVTLLIWIALNSTQWICDWIDNYQNKRYFKKWGMYAN